MSCLVLVLPDGIALVRKIFGALFPLLETYDGSVGPFSPHPCLFAYLSSRDPPAFPTEYHFVDRAFMSPMIAALTLARFLILLRAIIPRPPLLGS